MNYSLSMGMFHTLWRSDFLKLKQDANVVISTVTKCLTYFVSMSYILHF